MKTVVRLITTFAFLAQTAQAQTLSGFDSDTRASSTTSEYVFRSTFRENLVPIQVFGAVGKPGLYFVPPKTDLVKLLTLAGGANASSEKEVIVRKADQNWNSLKVKGLKKEGQAYGVDVKKVLLTSESINLTMSPHDIVYVPPKEPWISQDIYRTVSVVSLVMSVVLTGVLINQNQQKN